MPYYFYNNIVIGLVGILLFRFRNPDKHYLNLVSVGTLLFSLMPTLLLAIPEKVTSFHYSLSVLLLIVAYILRFLRKNSRGLIEYVKLCAIILFAISPYLFQPEKDWDYLTAFQNLAIPIAGIVFVYDRWILKPEPMKKKFIVVLVAQTLLILFAFLYAFVQQIEVTRNAEEANRQRNLAEVSKMEATKCAEEIRRVRQN